MGVCVLRVAGRRLFDGGLAYFEAPGAVQYLAGCRAGQIVRGEIDIGFNTDQVRVALGEPDRMFTRTTADGSSQVWSYRDRGPRFGFGVGVGMGSWGSRGGTYGGVGLGTGGGYHDDEKLGVVFDPSGRVAAIETRNR
jgi:hypothetical protein